MLDHMTAAATRLMVDTAKFNLIIYDAVWSNFRTCFESVHDLIKVHLPSELVEFSTHQARKQSEAVILSAEQVMHSAQDITIDVLKPFMPESEITQSSMTPAEEVLLLHTLE